MSKREIPEISQILNIPRASVVGINHQYELVRWNVEVVAFRDQFSTSGSITQK